MLRILKGLFGRLLGTPGRLTAVSGYLALFTVMGVGFCSVPLAFQFMGDEEFGLWNVLSQSLGLLLLIDFGVSSAASRILAEPLQAGARDEIDSWWTVLVLVLGAQGLAMLLIGLTFEPVILRSFPIPQQLQDDAQLLWRTLILASAVKNPFQALTGILFCQNRLYHMHFANAFGSLVNLVVFFILLKTGLGIRAFAGAVMVNVAVTVVYWYLAVRKSGLRLHLRPRHFSAAKLKTLYSYSGSIFLLAVAGQVVVAAQPMIVAAAFGVAAAAPFAISMKAYTVLSQVLSRTVDAKTPRWLLLHVEGRTAEIVTEWKRLIRWITPIVFFCAAGLLVFNRSFVALYVSPDMHEGRDFDALLAVTLVIQQLARPLLFLFVMTRRTWSLSTVAMIDAAVQVALGCLFVRWWGAPGVMAAGIFGTLLTSIPFILAMAPGLVHSGRRSFYTGILPDIIAGSAVLASVWLFVSRPGAYSGWFPQAMEWYAGILIVVLAGWGMHRLAATGIVRFGTR
jgi:O-antigen/teichoic acid export membrane protein